MKAGSGVRNEVILLVLVSLAVGSCGGDQASSSHTAQATQASSAFGTWYWNGSDWALLTETTPTAFMSAVPGVSRVWGRLEYWKGYGGLIALDAVEWGASRWNGAAWVTDGAFPAVPPRGYRPPPTLFPPPSDWTSSSLVMDDASGQLLFVTADQVSVWSDGVWRSVPLPVGWPNRIQYLDSAFDPDAAVVLIRTDSQAWTWDGKSMALTAPVPDSTGSGFRLLADGRGHVLAFRRWWTGDDYSWNGRVWTRVSGGGDCPQSLQHVISLQMVYDSVEHSDISAGFDVTGRLHVWRWQDTSWKEISTKSSPLRGEVSNLAFDPTLPGIVAIFQPMLGGWPSDGPFYEC